MTDYLLICTADLPGEKISRMDWSPDGNVLAVSVNGLATLFLLSPFDLLAPIISVVAPQNNFSTNADHIALSGIITDDTQVNSGEYQLNSGSWVPLSLGVNKEFSLDVSLIEGSNTITIRATDIYGKNSTLSIIGIRQIDQQPPMIYNITTNANEIRIGELLHVYATIEDSWSGVNGSSVKCLINRLPNQGYIEYPMTFLGGNQFHCEINTSGLLENNYTINITAADNRNNIDTLFNAKQFLCYDLPQVKQVIITPDPIYSTSYINVETKITDQSGIINAIILLDDSPDFLNPVGFVLNRVNDTIFSTILPPQTYGLKYYFIEIVDGIGKLNQTVQNSFNVIPVPCLSVTPASQNLNSFPGTVSFNVSNACNGTMNYSSQVTTGSDWLTILTGGSGGNNGTINLTYTENFSLTPRAGIITVTAPGATGSPKTVILTQRGSILPEITLANKTVFNGQSNCYNALQTIVVAGNGSNFTIQNGGTATMIAGLKINYLPNTTVNSGGYLWGYIAPGGPFCLNPSMPAILKQEEQSQSAFVSEKATIKIYPNPTTRNFILELNGDIPLDKVTVDIYGIWREKVLAETLNGERKHEFSLSDRPTGVYFIRVISGDKAETVKLIKQ
jgi:hypothetical protein